MHASIHFRYSLLGAITEAGEITGSINARIDPFLLLASRSNSLSNELVFHLVFLGGRRQGGVQEGTRRAGGGQQVRGP